MIKETLSKFIFTFENTSDGGLESLLYVIKYYKRNTASLNIKYLINELYENPNSFERLSEAANQYGLLAVTCRDIDVRTVMDYNQPIILNTATCKTQNIFVVCLEFVAPNSFRIYDPKKGTYTISVIGMQSLWKDGMCLAFVKQ